MGFEHKMIKKNEYLVKYLNTMRIVFDINKSKKKSWENTVWKSQDFSEINFSDCRSENLAILTILRALSFDV